MATAQYETAYHPRVHGFHFKNAFAGPFKKLCGGMCWASLDRYFGHTKEPIPPGTAAPAPGSPLYEEILARQTASILPNMAWAKVLDWMARPDMGHWHDRHSVGHLTQSDEWPIVRSLVQRGIPATIFLVEVKLGGDPARNHQVVVWRYEEDANQRVSLFVYDSNWPDDDTVCVAFTLGASDSRLSATHSKGDSVRGFFYNTYDKPLVYIPPAKVLSTALPEPALLWLMLGGPGPGGA
jgi:hypothetical protein